jgi:trehalose 6-phosphate synthase
VGGLSSALLAALQGQSALWIAAGKSPHDRPPSEPFPLPDSDLEVVHLDIPKGLHERHYLGFSNRVLWPVSHGFPNLVRYRRWDFAGYLKVNEAFARAVANTVGPDDSIWIHDYQLAPLPAMLRLLRPELAIHTFWHIPFPDYEVFRAVPGHEEILAGMLGADRIDFHLDIYADSFRSAVRNLMGARVVESGRQVDWEGRRVRIGVNPVGIDPGFWEEFGRQDRVRRDAEKIRRQSGEARIVLGVDRLDYTKGIRERFLAVERLLEEHRHLRGKFTLIQIAVPSRSRVPEYRELRREIDETVGRINGRFADGSYVPIRYHYRSFRPEALAGFYRSADVILITPLRDGLNLVAMESMMVNVDRPPVLVLSELAGVSRLLPEAILVNPYDAEGLAENLHRALVMPEEERLSRGEAIVRRIRSHTAHDWLERVERPETEEEESPYDLPIGIAPE